jgi:hypothetical protein
MGMMVVTPYVAAITNGYFFQRGNWNDLGLSKFQKKHKVVFYLQLWFLLLETSIVLIIGGITDWIELSTLGPQTFYSGVFSTCYLIY